MFVEQRTRMRKAQLVGVLEEMCRTLELSASQSEIAEKRYNGVGGWLAASDSPLLRAIAIYLQGSTAIGTTVKPIGSNEHDVDLVAHMSDLGLWVPPAELKKAIGDRLKENGHYAPLLTEMPRCWRLEYANEFHLDITPSIPNPSCGNGGELVPDRALKEWKPSNPKGYKGLFLTRAKLMPRMRLAKEFAEDRHARADIEPYPAQGGFKGILARTVQVLKRHRDVHFERLDLDPRLTPISVIITTLASQSYAYCVERFIYDDELDLLCDVIRRMPHFIEARSVSDGTEWFIWNETTAGENFAEKWNKDPERAEAFYSWHAQALADMEVLAETEGLDRLSARLGDAFGRSPTTQVLDSITNRVSDARAASKLVAAPIIGLSTSAASATPVRSNTFFGR